MSVTVASVFKLPDPITGARLSADGWRRTVCAIACPAGKTPVRAFEHTDAPGLAYHRLYGVKEIAYTVTHTESGLRCSSVALSHAECRAIIADLASGLDWTQPRDVIANTPHYRNRSRHIGAVYCDCSPQWMIEDDHL